MLGVHDRHQSATGAGMSATLRGRGGRWGAALLVLLFIDGQPAHARSPKDGAAQLDALAKRAYRDGNYADALAAFEGAYEADPLPRFLYNLGRCHQKLGDMARASHFFERYLDTAGKAKDRKEVKALATMLRIKLRKEFSELVVTANVADALVQIELKSGKINGTTPFSYWVPFGQHDVVVTADGHEAWREPVVVKPKKLAKLHAALKKATSASPPAKPTKRRRVEAILVAPRAAMVSILVAPRAAMVYRANRADPKVDGAWFEPGFADDAWRPGSYGVGYDRHDDAQGLVSTWVPAGTSSVYTRARFTVDDPAQVTRLWFGAEYDDGAVAWLNGVEIWRSKLMQGEGGKRGPAWDDRPSAEHESSNAAAARIEDQEVTKAALPALVAGDNVLAVGAWNRSANSSDLVLAPSLKAERWEPAP